MKKLVDPKKNPPNLRFVDPDTGYRYEQPYRNIEELLAHIHKYRTANGKPPIPAARIVVENYICSQPGSERHCRELTSVERHRTLREWRRGGVAFLKSKFIKLTQGDEARFVSEEHAAKRANVCLRCPLNMRFKKQSQLEHHADQAQIRDLEGRELPTEIEKNLYNCLVCGCNLKTKVWYSEAIVQSANADLTAEERADIPDEKKQNVRSKDGKFFTCWMQKEPE